MSIRIQQTCYSVLSEGGILNYAQARTWTQDNTGQTLKGRAVRGLVSTVSRLVGKSCLRCLSICVTAHRFHTLVCHVSSTCQCRIFAAVHSKKAYWVVANTGPGYIPNYTISIWDTICLVGIQHRGNINQLKRLECGNPQGKRDVSEPRSFIASREPALRAMRTGVSDRATAPNPY
ncbi:hypothetical protein CGLO_07932 [Colletotrichum gloeosporioides Cg-14]|uniref:Uncharacterized protein n=1 Tax=Colletotrichum gloeosporioides (strain Cg-14) TaxID=1237896 RepID=T0KKL2_COLGC|nr:hypothetical protein CGLO_07932 [Colletotrichum gloeosporioides Cg-14]